MSINELDKKVQELRDLRNFEAEVRSEITAIEDDLKAEMLAKNTDTLTTANSKTNYLKQLRELAMSFGYMPEMVDRLSARGFAPEEIEEFFYEGMCDY